VLLVERGKCIGRKTPSWGGGGGGGGGGAIWLEAVSAMLGSDIYCRLQTDGGHKHSSSIASSQLNDPFLESAKKIWSS